MGVFQNNLMGAAAAAASAGGGDFYEHQIANSARFTGSGVLSRTAGTPTNVDKFTISCWVKRSKLTTANNFVFGYTDNINYQKLAFNSTDKLELHEQRGAGDSNGLRTVDQVFRDTSAWYNVVWVYDSGNATEADREIFYVNGTRLSDVEGWDGGYPTQNRDSVFNKSGATIHIGSASSYYGSYFQGYMAEVVFNDGQAYAASNYGETKNGVWVPKDVSGLTFGNNGFHLNFASSSDMGNDVSGNNNDFSESGVDTHDQMLDTPTFNSSSNGGNFCTYSPLVAQGSAQKLMTLSEGNLLAKSETNDKYHQTIGTMGVKTGKWYTEFYIKAAGYPSWAVGWHYGSQLGLFNGDVQANNANLAYLGYFTGSNVYVKGFSGTSTATSQVAYSGWTSAGDAPTTGDVMMVAMDFDAGKAWYGFNGEWGDVGSGTGNPATGANASVTWTVADFADYKFPFTLSWANPDAEIVMNCGQDGTFAGNITAGGNADDTGYGNFKYDVPAGFLALCTGNLPDPAADPADDDGPGKYFNTVTYTGTGSSQGITGIGFQPDVVLIKNRGQTDNWNHQNDVLGVGKTQALNTSSAVADETDCIDSFDSDGFTVDSDHKVNASSETYVAYCWKESADAGFDIYTYSGTGSAVTVSHSLGVAPDLILNFLNTGSAWDSTSYWNTPNMGTGKGIFMTLTNAAQSTTYVDSTNTSNFVTTNMSTSGRNYFGYAIANKEGLVKAGEYKGNGNADGSFVYTGFGPALVVNKRIDGSGSWLVHDNARNTFNVTDKIVLWNGNDAEFSGSNDKIDMVSNGFKIRSSNAGINGSGNDYIYLAMAHNPFKYATGR